MHYLSVDALCWTLVMHQGSRTQLSRHRLLGDRPQLVQQLCGMANSSISNIPRAKMVDMAHAGGYSMLGGNRQTGSTQARAMVLLSPLLCSGFRLSDILWHVRHPVPWEVSLAVQRSRLVD